LNESELAEKVEEEYPVSIVDWLSIQSTDDLVKLIKASAKEYMETKKVGSAQVRWMTKWGLATFLIVVGCMVLLTLYGKIGGDALMFFIGTVVGYFLTYMSRAIR